jgi:hypothetical protein
MIKRAEFDYAVLEFSDQILKVTIKEAVELTTEILESILEKAADFAEGQKFCIMSDMRLDVTSTSEARKYAAKNAYMSQHLAYALIANTTAVILLTNFFIKVNKPAVPSRLFKNEEDALAWLQGILAAQ